MAIQAFSSACAGGALAKLERLALGKNKIGDKGLEAFSGALATGALPSLEELVMDDGPLGIDHPQLKAACKQRSITCEVKIS